MNDILSKVTPLTRGIIWLLKGNPESGSKTYKGIDYLLNGLLTANLAETEAHVSSRVMVTTNFHHPLHVLVVHQFAVNEFESYLQLVEKGLTAENSILVIDEVDGWSNLVSKTPKELKTVLQLFK